MVTTGRTQSDGEGGAERRGGMHLKGRTVRFVGTVCRPPGRESSGGRDPAENKKGRENVSGEWSDEGPTLEGKVQSISISRARMQ